MKKTQRIAALRARTQSIASTTGLRPAFRNAVTAAKPELGDAELKSVVGSTERPYRDYCVVV